MEPSICGTLLLSASMFGTFSVTIFLRLDGRSLSAADCDGVAKRSINVVATIVGVAADDVGLGTGAVDVVMHAERLIQSLALTD